MHSYHWYRFEQLDAHTLYALLKLRSDIFVVEQNCVFSDMDGYDPASEHLVARNAAGQVVGYARLLPPGLKYEEASIGRVVMQADERGRQAGRRLMLAAIGGCRERFPNSPILLWAQQRLENFYSSLGFECCSEAEIEDGILHVKMLSRPNCPPFTN